MAALAQLDLTQQGALSGLPMPLTIRTARALSDEELMRLARQNRPYRIERNPQGELEIMSPLGFEGGQRELLAMRLLGNWAEIHGGACASSDTGFRLPSSAVRSPDASWVSQARVDALTPEERRHFPPICPDFLIEILSESDSRRALEAKVEMWIANGAQLAWMIDPFAQTVSIYRPGQPITVLNGLLKCAQTLLFPDSVFPWTASGAAEFRFITRFGVRAGFRR